MAFKMTELKQKSNFDEPLNITGKWVMVVTNMEVYITFQKITEKSIRLWH